jgi:hypothetical protein
MKNNSHKISLGFTNELFEPGVHICQIFNSDEERQNALVNYIVSGIEAGENTVCFSDKETEDSMREFFEQDGISFDELKNSGHFSLHKSGESYFEGGTFEPERMLDKIKSLYLSSMKEDLSGARVIGEMLPEVENIPGGNRLMEYESKVSMLLRKYPVTSVCQYDAREFDGATLLEILKVHPYMIVHGSVVHNPFYIHPEEYLKGKLSDSL